MNPLTNAKIIGADISREQYMGNEVPRGHLDYVMSRSSLKQFAACPHRWVSGYKDMDTKFTEWGNLIDCMVLQWHKFDKTFCVTPEKYESRGMQCPECLSITDSATCRKCKTDRVAIIIEKPWDWNATVCQAWREERNGLAPVKWELHQNAMKAIDVIQKDSVMMGVLLESQKQVMWVAEYHDDETGIVVPLGGLIDIMPDADGDWGAMLIDFKTASTAAPGPWRWVVDDRWYDAQGALYLDACSAAGEERSIFAHFIQESFEPWEVGKRMLSDEFIEIGRGKYLNALKRYCRCLSEKHWPGYDEDHGGTVISGFTLVEPDGKMLLRAIP
jgi:hypothetical protein